jgi:hypothetical protein
MDLRGRDSANWRVVPLIIFRHHPSPLRPGWLHVRLRIRDLHHQSSPPKSRTLVVHIGYCSTLGDHATSGAQATASRARSLRPTGSSSTSPIVMVVVPSVSCSLMLRLS